MEIKLKDKTALIFGATGLTGKALVDQILADDRYSTVRIFVRRPVGITHPKLEAVIDDLSDPGKIAGKIKGDELFCCLGTTLKKAGSKEAFTRVDLGLPAALAKIAHRNGVGKFLVISSVGANPRSGNFYLRTKGMMEEQVGQYNFRQLSIFRPSFLIGKRDEFRFGEETGKILFAVLGFLLVGPLKKYRGIKVETVARAMVTVANNIPAKKVYQSHEIARLGKPDRQ